MIIADRRKVCLAVVSAGNGGKCGNHTIDAALVQKMFLAGAKNLEQKRMDK